VILLMRLRNDGSKNDYEVQIEENINLRDFVDPNKAEGTSSLYILTGIINHRGVDIQSGKFYLKNLACFQNFDRQKS
jgi:hypothetical protein